MFDKPVEEAVEWTFHKAFETFGGKEAVMSSPSTGRERLLTNEVKSSKVKEKEL
jgi:mitochondrial fission process protein 1